MKQTLYRRIKGWQDYLRREALTLWFCLCHRQTPLRLKVALSVLGMTYAASVLLTDGYAMGLSFIPDWVPVIGLFDDVLLLPIAIYLVARWVPQPVRLACRRKAASRQGG